jgi:hypothetical protein
MKISFLKTNINTSILHKVLIFNKLQDFHFRFYSLKTKNIKTFALSVEYKLAKMTKFFKLKNVPPQYKPISTCFQPPCYAQTRLICHQDFVFQFTAFEKHTLAIHWRNGL